jgi:hypothetical protein
MKITNKVILKPERIGVSLFIQAPLVSQIIKNGGYIKSQFKKEVKALRCDAINYFAVEDPEAKKVFVSDNGGETQILISMFRDAFYKFIKQKKNFLPNVPSIQDINFNKSSTLFDGQYINGSFLTSPKIGEGVKVYYEQGVYNSVLLQEISDCLIGTLNLFVEIAQKNNTLK